MYFIIICTRTTRPTVLNFRSYIAARHVYEAAAHESNADSIILIVDGKVEAATGLSD